MIKIYFRQVTELQQTYIIFTYACTVEGVHIYGPWSRPEKLRSYAVHQDFSTFKTVLLQPHGIQLVRTGINQSLTDVVDAQHLSCCKQQRSVFILNLTNNRISSRIIILVIIILKKESLKYTKKWIVHLKSLLNMDPGLVCNPWGNYVFKRKREKDGDD